MEGAEKLLELANKALPGGWDAMVKQAYIYGSMYIVGAVIAGIVAVIIHIKVKASGNEVETDSDIAMTGVMIACAILSMIGLISGILYLINPQYQAIQMLRP